MNNDDLKRLMKKEINLEIKDCLGEIKTSDVDVEPCNLQTKYVRHAKKYAFYALVGLILVSASSYQAYRYVTPSTYITIEVGHSKNELSLDSENKERSIDNFLIQVNINDFNHVIDISTTNNDLKNVKLAHMNYRDAFPIIVEYLFNYTNKSNSLTFTVFTDDYNKCYTIEDFIATEIFNEDYQQVHINKYKYDANSDVSYGVQCAINEILEKTNSYTKDDLKDKSLKELIEILMSL